MPKIQLIGRASGKKTAIRSSEKYPIAAVVDPARGRTCPLRRAVLAGFLSRHALERRAQRHNQADPPDRWLDARFSCAGRNARSIIN